MKRHMLRILAVALLAASATLPLFACGSEDTPADTKPDTTVEQPTEAPDTDPAATDPQQTEAETEPQTPTVPPVDPATFGQAAITYECEDGSILSTYAEKTAADFEGVCSFYTQSGYALYNESNMGGNLAATYTKGEAMAHIYWHPSNGELNVVLSDTAGGTLPPATPAVTDGTYECTVTQMQDAEHVNGMSYVIQLKDGSYIIYDGGYANLTNTMETFLKENYKGEGKPVIRAWVLTHSHNDHYPLFQMFAKRAGRGEKFIIENIIVSPMNEKNYFMNDPNDRDPYLSVQFYEDIETISNVNVVFAHTGMRFTFCNLDMEILYAPESYYKTTDDLGNFNNTSIVSRLTGNGYSALFMGDVAIHGSTVMEELYGDYLKSDMCQISHHGVEDVPLSFYEYVQAPILFYPCNQWLYDQTERHWEERQAMEDWACTKEILIQGLNRYTRAWGTTFAADAPLSMPDYIPPVTEEEEETEAEPTPPVASDLLTTDKTAYTVGEPIMVTAQGSGTDWVGIAEKGASSSLRWWYVNTVGAGTPFDLLAREDESAGKLSGNLPAGEYEIRVIANDQSWAVGTVLASVSITITE